MKNRKGFLMLMLLILIILKAPSSAFAQNKVTKLLPLGESLILEGQENFVSLSSARHIFDFIDPRLYEKEFQNQFPGKSVELAVYEIKEDTKLIDAFKEIGLLSELVLSQEQIILFFEKYETFANHSFGGNLFLIRVSGSFYFIDVKIIEASKLCFLVEIDSNFEFKGALNSLIIAPYRLNR